MFVDQIENYEHHNSLAGSHGHRRPYCLPVWGRSELLAVLIEMQTSYSPNRLSNIARALDRATGWGQERIEGTASALRDVIGTLSASGTSDAQLNLIASRLGK